MSVTLGDHPGRGGVGPQFSHVLSEMDGSGFRVLTSNEAISSEIEFLCLEASRLLEELRATRSVPGLSRKDACVTLGRQFSCSLTLMKSHLIKRYTGKLRGAWILWS